MNLLPHQKKGMVQSLGAKYDHTSNLPIEDQFYISESLEEREHGLTDNANVRWNENGTYKHTLKFKLTRNKLRAIKELNTFTYITPPIKISKELEILFTEYQAKEGHWLYIAQHWNPRSINRVINYIVKCHISGSKSIQNPAAYFTKLIKLRKKRRSI